MDSAEDHFSRYLPTDQQARKWGWRLVHAGRQSIRKGESYPAEGHPFDYLFDRRGNRTLDEFQLVFVASGKGSFSSASQKEVTIEGGDAFLLFPGEWHRYRPDVNTGWTEYWVGFRGREAERIMREFFSPENPVYRVGHAEALLRQFDQILHWLREPVAVKEQILASHLPLLLALLRAGNPGFGSAEDRETELISRAKAALLANIKERTDLQGLSAELGMSYSRFRLTFKKRTGFSPREFENRIKLNRARDLLRRDGLTVSETADALGYSSVYYFSRAFKKEFGTSPRNWLME